ncbi:MAK10-like protein [Tanacetum coccineum]
MGDENPIRTLRDYSKPCQRLFQFSLRDHAINWLERLLAGSITTWEDLTTRFLAQFFPPGRTKKLRNDILMFQQHHVESLSEAWTHFKDLPQKVPHYGIDLWLQNNPRDFAKPVKAIALPQDVPSAFDCRLIELKNQVQCLMEAHLALTQLTQVNNVTTSCEICSGPYDTQYCMEDPEQAFIEYASSRTDEARDCHLPGEWEIARDAELNPFKDTLVFRRMVEFLGAIPINLKSNMCQSEDLIKNPINWDKPPINEDGAWHAMIRLIDPDGEEFTKTLQSIPTTRKLSERESPREIIDLDRFYDT